MYQPYIKTTCLMLFTSASATKTAFTHWSKDSTWTSEGVTKSEVVAPCIRLPQCFLLSSLYQVNNAQALSRSHGVKEKSSDHATFFQCPMVHIPTVALSAVNTDHTINIFLQFLGSGWTDYASLSKLALFLSGFLRSFLLPIYHVIIIHRGHNLSPFPCCLFFLFLI